MEELLQDWIGVRDKQTFVHTGNENRSGWDRHGSWLSSFLLRNKTLNPIDFLKVAYQKCNGIVKLMAKGKKVNLSFHPSQSFTDGRRVNVSTEVADCKKLSLEERLDVLLGLTTHEMAHILFSKFDPKYHISDFQANIENIIDDEHIEYRTGNLFPGLAKGLAKTKSYYFDFKHRKETFTDLATQAYNCFFLFVRYPDKLDLTLVAKHEGILHEIKDVLTPYPMDYDSVHLASVEVEKIFLRHFENKPNLPGEKDKGGLGMSKSQIEKTIKTILAKFNEADIRTNRQCGALSGNEDGDGVEAPSVIMSVLKGEADYSVDTQTLFKKAVLNQDNYKELHKEVLNNSRNLSTLLKMDCFIPSHRETGLRNGTLDETKLVEAVGGSSLIFFEKVIRKRKNTLRVALLVDESGSMRMGNKIIEASKSAILIATAIQQIPLAELYVYGFTSDHSSENTNDITIYIEPGFNSVSSLGSLSAKSCNRDGVCIREVCKRIRKFTSEKVLLFVISDGAPSASCYEGIKDTALAVKEATKQNFIPIQIGIDVNSEVQALMFDRFVNFVDPGQLVNEKKKYFEKR